MEHLSRCERGQLARAGGGRRRVLRHFEDSHDRAGAISELRQPEHIVLSTGPPLQCGYQGVQHSLRRAVPLPKYEQWTPFGELLYGHGGTRGEARANGLDLTEVSSGRALLAGGGADHKITERLALRIKIDYLQTATSFPSLGKKKQDNLRLSVGIVIRSVRKKRRRLEDETEPEP